ncbi:MAG: hypothetical protein JNK87_20600 [Bryobacterales bacterium]|nr:hypothetical protein [Bryobacterales bacterium]
MGPISQQISKIQIMKPGQQMTAEPQSGGGGMATAGQVAALQAKLAEHESRIRNLEGMLGHLVSTVSALQAQVWSQRTGI